MIHNDVLRSLRYILNVNDAKMAEIFSLAGLNIQASEIENLLKKEDEIGFVECSDNVMAHFLNGLVLFKRGKDENRAPQALITPVTNNIILKKIRVAFELKDEDLRTMIEKAGLTVSKTELSAFFRSPDHRNYRDCGDQFLRNIIRELKN